MELRHAPPHVLIPADIPKGLAVASVTPTELPADWVQTPAPSALRAFGSKWLERGQTAVLQVPSAIVHDESNFTLNPLHPDFAGIQVGEARSFGFDGRL